MILQALTNLYEILVQQGKLDGYGWQQQKVSWGLELDDNGQCVGIIPYRYPGGKNEKMIPRIMSVPASGTRTSGISACFLCDKASYIFGTCNEVNPKKLEKSMSFSEKCFEASAKLHKEILETVDTPAAKAILKFYNNWIPHPDTFPDAVQKYQDDIQKEGNILFVYDGHPVTEDKEIRQAWLWHFQSKTDQEDDTMQCLITGERHAPLLTHPVTKGIVGAQSSGAALVSFNSPAFNSYGHTQNENAPVSQYAAYAYTSALNYLVSHKEHNVVCGDTTILYWAEDGDEAIPEFFKQLINGAGDNVSNRDLKSIMTAIARGEPCRFNNIPLKPNNAIYIIGIIPNVARLSVRFAYKQEFGSLIKRLQQHYDDVNIVEDATDHFPFMPLWVMLNATVNPKVKQAKPMPRLAGDVMHSILSGAVYPENLLNLVLLRIKAEREITRARAGIIKGYIKRYAEYHPAYHYLQEVATVSLNEESNFTPYVLGRLFAVLEGIQESASPELNATIRDKYLNSASTTPAVVFPGLLKLSEYHRKKMGNKLRIYWDKQVQALTNKLSEELPDFIPLKEQCAFMIGYYHQRQKRFEKKPDDTDNQSSATED